MKLYGNNEGTILIMVLLFMLSAMLIGIALMKSTIIETKIVANERAYNQSFYRAESAAEITIPQFDSIVSATTWGIDSRVDISSRMPVGSAVSGANVGMTLRRTGNPPTGSGSSAAKTTAMFYRVDATVDNRTVEMGLWKAFPKPGS